MADIFTDQHYTITTEPINAPYFIFLYNDAEKYISFDLGEYHIKDEKTFRDFLNSDSVYKRSITDSNGFMMETGDYYIYVFCNDKKPAIEKIHAQDNTTNISPSPCNQ